VLGVGAAVALMGIGVGAASTAVSASDLKIVMIYADDIGYGDFGCYGATRVKTPNVDRLAAAGRLFTDGHAPAATCTPSRFALLTGKYAWRVPGTGVLPGDAALVIPPDRPTLPKMLRKAGLRTGVVGKWHLGLGEGGEKIDWNGRIEPGPEAVGFDEHFIIPATGDRVPCVYVADNRVVGLDPSDPIAVSYKAPIGDEPTGREHPELLKVRPSHGHDQTIVNGVSRIGSMTGGKSARWVDEDMADTITREAVGFLERNKDRPFFLYFATHDIHVPRVPNRRFVGRTDMGARGDAIAEFDWSTGQILDALDRLGIADETLVILSSDNGPVIDDGYQDEAVTRLGDHRAAGPLRGGKYSLFEGGTRVPFLVRWPGKVAAGSRSDALVSQIDLYASLARLAGQGLGEDEAPDSVDVLDALVGDAKDGREELVHQANGLALRRGSWKYIPPGRGAARLANTNVESGQAPTGRLYDLAADLGETRDVAGEHPEKARAMAARIEEIRASSRTRPAKP
jgi:arylsulfatase A-like enzyme